MTLIFILTIILASWLFAFKDYLRWREVYIEKEQEAKRAINAKWHDYSALTRFAFLLVGLFWIISSSDISFTKYSNFIFVSTKGFIVRGIFIAIFHWFLADGIMNLYKAQFDKNRKSLPFFKIWFYTKYGAGGSTARTEILHWKQKVVLMIISTILMIWVQL